SGADSSAGGDAGFEGGAGAAGGGGGAISSEGCSRAAAGAGRRQSRPRATRVIAPRPSVQAAYLMQKPRASSPKPKKPSTPPGRPTSRPTSERPWIAVTP